MKRPTRGERLILAEAKRIKARRLILTEAKWQKSPKEQLDIFLRKPVADNLPIRVVGNFWYCWEYRHYKLSGYAWERTPPDLDHIAKYYGYALVDFDSGRAGTFYHVDHVECEACEGNGSWQVRDGDGWNDPEYITEECEECSATGRVEGEVTVFDVYDELLIAYGEENLNEIAEILEVIEAVRAGDETALAGNEAADDLCAVIIER